MGKIISLEDALKSHPDEHARRVLEQAINTDFLTGLLNRRGFDERLDRAISRAERHSIGFTYGFVDIYGLSIYNETGYQYGDEAIKKLAGILEETARKEDAVGRTGGDEFSLVITGLTEKEHFQYLERMKARIAEEERILEDIPFIAYWGLAEYKGQSTIELFSEADKKLIEDKEKIKNYWIKPIVE